MPKIFTISTKKRERVFMIRMLYVLLACSIVVVAQVPTFNEAVSVKCNNEEIQVGNSCPCVYDWTGDEKKDLLIGQFTGGKIRLYENEGTDEAPVFNSFSYLKAGGVDISLSLG